VVEKKVSIGKLKLNKGMEGSIIQKRPQKT
jgi:hypothetical protein